MVQSEKKKKKVKSGTSLVAQWLGLWSTTAGSKGWILGQENKIPHAILCSQKKKNLSEVYGPYQKQFSGFDGIICKML